jgi:hypothetical protein
MVDVTNQKVKCKNKHWREGGARNMNIVILLMKVPHNNAYLLGFLFIEKRTHRKYTEWSSP